MTTAGRFSWVPAVLVIGAMGLVLSQSAPPRSERIAAAAAEDSPPAQEASATRKHVIVVGAGISGLCAALELGRGGADVTVIDMSSVFGGHAVMSQGGLTLVDTPLQREVGIEDSPELAFNDFVNWGPDANEPWVRYYVEHSRVDIYNWLVDVGIRFEGIELGAPGNTADRFHQPVNRGIGLVTPIYRACLDHDSIRFVWNTQVTGLIKDDVRITGIEVRELRTGKVKQMPADAVVLATGGFQSNLDMVREYWPDDTPFPSRILIGSGRNSTGLGHRLAEQAGGTLSNMEFQWNYFTGIPDPRHPESQRGLSAANMYGILVNSDGVQFANLHDWAKAVMPPLLAHEPATCWWIFDEASKPNFVVSGTEWTKFEKVERLILNNPDLVQSADTLAELAEKTGLPAAALEETVRRWNELVDKGVDEDFHRFGPDKTAYNNLASPKIGTPPFYAMQSWPITRKSMGGVAIDLECRATDQSGQPIPGLYAVGELTGLAGVNGRAALEGTFLAPCVLTGRVAAKSILGTLNDLTPPAAAEISTERCADCHDIPDLIANKREGYWHFEECHRVVLERELNCLQCHAEMAPYDEASHRIQPATMTGACIQCHIAQE